MMSKNIRIVSPAKAISGDLIERAALYLEEKGHVVTVGEYAKGNNHYFSGTVAQRRADFQNAIDSPNIDIILCARGGYGCIQIVDDLDFTALKNHPKQIIGFSDVTVFHMHCNVLGLETIHATMPLNFSDNTDESLLSLTNAIENKTNSYRFAPHKLNILGSAKAEIIGGNLAIIQTLIGTDSDCNFKNKILFLEDVSEYVYTIDRMMWSLKKADKLKDLSGLIVGGMSNIKDTEVPFGKAVEDVILDHVSAYNYPVCFNFPAGHLDNNCALVFGRESEFTVAAAGVSLVN